MDLVKKLAVTAALTMLAVGVAAPASAAPTIGRPHYSNGQLIQMHDCRPITTKPDPRRTVRGRLMDNLATPQRDLVYVRSHGMGFSGRTTHFCYR